MKKIFLFSVILLSGLTPHIKAQIITTVAGGGTADPGDGGAAIDCALDHPAYVVMDASGNIYFCERDNHRVRKISPSGIITTIAGTGVAGNSGDGGPATNAMVKSPYAIAIDHSGNILVGDGNAVIRKINTSGVISTIAGTGTPGFSGDGGNATAAQLNGPGAIAIDAMGNIYCTDNFNHRVRKIDVTGVITTVVGTGTPGYSGDGGAATAAQLDRPAGLCFDKEGNMFIADYIYDCVRKVNNAGLISTFAGIGSSGYSGDDGPATSARLNNPIGVAADAHGNILISDTFNDRIRKVNSAGIITTVAGNGNVDGAGDGGLATNASLNRPVGVYVNVNGDIYIGDMSDNRIRLVKNTVSVSTFEEENVSLLNAFPNPSDGTFALEVRSSANEDVPVVITNISGQPIKELKVRSNVPTPLSLDVPSGLYIVTAFTSTGYYSQKLTLIK